MPAGSADEHARENGAASEAAQREAVREALAEDDHHERAHGPAGGAFDQARELILPREEHLGRASPGHLDEDQHDNTDRDADNGCQQHHSAFDDRLEHQRQPLDGGAEDRSDDADHDRPQKLGHTGAAGRRDVRDREREGAEAGPVVEPDEDQRADTGSEQPGREHHSEHRAADPGHLHHQERGRKRRAEERADRGEAPGGADHDTGHLRRVPLDQVEGEDSEAAADRDQRRLRAEDDPEAERGERGNDDPWELDRRHGAR